MPQQMNPTQQVKQPQQSQPHQQVKQPQQVKPPQQVNPTNTVSQKNPKIDLLTLLQTKK